MFNNRWYIFGDFSDTTLKGGGCRTEFGCLVTLHVLTIYTLLGMVSVFQENRVRIHVKLMFAWKTVRLFPTQTKRKHNKIIPSVCIWKRKPVWFFVFWKNRQKILCIQGKQRENAFSPFSEYKESNSFPFLCENGWNNFIMFSLCLRGKQSNCFPGKHELYMYSNSNRRAPKSDARFHYSVVS